VLDRLEGRARLFGDDVNSDYIISSTRKRATLDESVLKQYLLEGVDPGFAASVRCGDLLVAGRNFGCGSAMEIAATVILAAGIPAVLAASFARSFYRNAINNGLIPIECDTTRIAEGDTIRVRSRAGGITIENLTTRETLSALRFPDIVLQILEAGGLVPFLRARGRFPAS
jgi:3-isopropylmalate/(R)-2-methylmalate dehydratase small subunit